MEELPYEIKKSRNHIRLKYPKGFFGDNDEEFRKVFTKLGGTAKEKREKIVWSFPIREGTINALEENINRFLRSKEGIIPGTLEGKREPWEQIEGRKIIPGENPVTDTTPQFPPPRTLKKKGSRGVKKSGKPVKTTKEKAPKKEAPELGEGVMEKFLTKFGEEVYVTETIEGGEPDAVYLIRKEALKLLTENYPQYSFLVLDSISRQIVNSIYLGIEYDETRNEFIKIIEPILIESILNKTPEE